MFELEAFRKQIYCFEESACDIVGTLRRPILIRRPANCAPAPFVMPLVTRRKKLTTFFDASELLHFAAKVLVCLNM